MAGVTGNDPVLSESKSDVLPLYYTPIYFVCFDISKRVKAYILFYF